MLTRGHLFIGEREVVGEREREKETSMGRPLIRTLTGDQTRDLLVYGLMLQLSHTSRGSATQTSTLHEADGVQLENCKMGQKAASFSRKRAKKRKIKKYLIGTTESSLFGVRRHKNRELRADLVFAD